MIVFGHVVNCSLDFLFLRDGRVISLLCLELLGSMKVVHFDPKGNEKETKDDQGCIESSQVQSTRILALGQQVTKVAPKGRVKMNAIQNRMTCDTLEK